MNLTFLYKKSESSKKNCSYFAHDDALYFYRVIVLSILTLQAYSSSILYIVKDSIK